ncbi:MAG TPA: asparagine synthase-related protein [Chthoniobacterales bacterium]|jgi:asparagine synthase (glutamine-hydrolysing)|nr:asparagine synthase-related protein [Chthoniobacterales bacterium]
MCGIAGMIGSDWTIHQFDELFDSIRHRGPDGSGVYQAADLRIGMHRLKIRGPDVRLPIQVNPDTVAAYNGQIYGVHTPGDLFSCLPGGIENEVAVVLSQVPNVDGMYACSLASMDGTSVSLKTDGHFIKPLFYRRQGQGIAFCSELRSLTRMSTSNRIDRAALAELFCYGWYLSDRSYLSNLNLVWKHDISVSGRTVQEMPKMPLPRAARPSDFKAEIRRAIRESVWRCMGGSGPFGIAISGGLDSSILAWELNAAGFESVVTLSICTDDGQDGLASLADLNLPSGGAWETWKHRTIILKDDAEFLTGFESSTALFGQPSTMSSLPLYLRLAEAAAEEGVRVLLTGEGVDEFFGGYASYAKTCGSPDPLDYYRHPPREKLTRVLFGDDELNIVQQRFAETYSGCADIRHVERDLRLTRLLLRTDVCLMSQSIEGRVPYLHNRIPELAMSVPWQELATAPGKRLLREAYRTELGARVSIRKGRFKASDSVLRRCLAKPELSKRISASVAQVFGKPAAERCLLILKTEDGFDADVSCLLMSLTFLLEGGRIDGHAG